MFQKISLPPDSVFSIAEVQRFRQDTSGTRQLIHLNNAGSGLMPDVVTKAQIAYIKLESKKGGYETANYMAKTIKGFYEQCALLYNTKASNIAFTSSATDAYTRALSSIPFQKSDVILTDYDGYVSNQIQFLSLQKRMGIQIMHIQNAASGGVDVDDLREKLHKHQPRLLAISHIPTNSGLVQPVAAIAKIYQEYLQACPDKTWYILDACQSTGQMKLDVQKLHCDFLSTTGRKFLRGPRGTGALYISDRALNAGLEPLFLDMRGADWIEKNKYQPKADARRFEDWEFAYAGVVGTKAAIEYCLSVGEDKIWQQLKLLAHITRQKLANLDKVQVLDRGSEQGALVTFHIQGADPLRIQNGLLKHKINISSMNRTSAVYDMDEKGVPWILRASPHYYNTLDEIDAFVDVLKGLI